MHEGFEQKRKYEENIHLEKMIVNRLNTSMLVNIQVKKTITPEMLYKLPGDKPKVKATKEQILAFFDRKDPVISNGKIRGYTDKNGKFEHVN